MELDRRRLLLASLAAAALPAFAARAVSLDPDNRIYQHNLRRLRGLIDTDAVLRRASGGDQ